MYSSQIYQTKFSKPRIQLHIHLEFSPHALTLWEIAQDNRHKLPFKTLDEFKKECVTKEPSTLSNHLKPLAWYLPLIKGNCTAIERIAYEMAEQQAREGVVYSEVHYRPANLASIIRSDGLSSAETVTYRMVLELVTKGFQRAEQDYGIKARSLLNCGRENPDEAREVLSLCEEFKDKSVVGIGLSGPWIGPNQDLEGEEGLRKEVIEVFQRAAQLGIHRTAHTGEAGPPSSVDRHVKFLHVERIGHGYRAVDDEVLYQDLLKKGIHFETCPHSSYLTGAVPANCIKHPIVKLAEDSADFSINTDDPLFTGTTLDDEYRLLQKKGLKDFHIVRANFNAAQSCFLPPQEKKDLFDHLKNVYGITGNQFCNHLNNNFLTV
ncbi:adenosine deaminase-like isoform X3 [Limulus polyphemus]|uniref:Adenosine deaminase n=1 Tax=Limulus polyphemus TaxID=6850 RepID=A0ABM1T506_LIMPO|nr:adenosine deaminase-like isoform X3 [Limulus polyphemus]